MVGHTNTNRELAKASQTRVVAHTATATGPSELHSYINPDEGSTKLGETT